MPWLPESFTAPERAELRGGHHLRQIRADDVDIDCPGRGGVGVVGLIDHMVGTPVEGALTTFVPGWLAHTWGLSAGHFHP